MWLTKVILFCLFVYYFKSNDAISVPLRAGKKLIKGVISRPYKALRTPKLGDHINLPNKLVSYTKSKSVGKLRNFGPRILRVVRKRVDKFLGRKRSPSTRKPRRYYKKRAITKSGHANVLLPHPHVAVEHANSHNSHLLAHLPHPDHQHYHHHHHHHHLFGGTKSFHPDLELQHHMNNGAQQKVKLFSDHHLQHVHHHHHLYGTKPITSTISAFTKIPHLFSRAKRTDTERRNRRSRTKFAITHTSQQHSAVTFPVGKWVSQYDYLTGVIRNFSQDMYRSLQNITAWDEDDENYGTTQPLSNTDASTTSTYGNQTYTFADNSTLSNYTERIKREFKSPASNTTQPIAPVTTVKPRFYLKTAMNLKQSLYNQGKWRADGIDDYSAHTTVNKHTVALSNIKNNSNGSASDESQFTKPWTSKMITGLWSGHWFSEPWTERFSYNTGTWDAREKTPSPWPVDPTAIWSGRYFTHRYTHHYKERTISPYTVEPPSTEPPTTTELSTPYVTGTYNYGNVTGLWSGRWFSEGWSPRFSYNTGTWDAREKTPSPWPVDPTAIWSGRYFTHRYTHHYKERTISPYTLEPPSTEPPTTTELSTPYVTGTYNYGNVTGLWSGRWFSEGWSPRFSYNTGTWDAREKTPSPWPTDPTAIWSGRYFTHRYTHHYKERTISPYTVEPTNSTIKVTTESTTPYVTGTYNYVFTK